MIKVLVVDDQALIRKGIISLLSNSKDIEIVGEATNGEEAIQQVNQYHPDVVLMDINMPKMDGILATQKILRISKTIKILILTVYDSVIYPLQLLAEGVGGYLTKTAGVEELEQAIRTLYQGGRYISKEIAQLLAINQFNTKGKQVPFDYLSKREFQIALLVSQGKSTPEIATLLHLSTKTINTYRYRIFEKLGIKNNVELSHLALQYDLVKKH